MNRILLEPTEVTDQNVAVLRDHRAAHIHSVLKAIPGQRLKIGMMEGPTGFGEVLSTTPDEATLRCEFNGGIPPRPAVDLLLALPRPKVMKRLWAQLAAVGVNHVYLTNADKVERFYFDSHVLHEQFIRAQFVEGLQQCGDTRLPTVSIHRQLKIFLEDDLPRETDRARWFAHPEATPPLATALLEARPRRVLIAIGPEGGWNQYEIQLFLDCGFQAAGLGPRILRADTACIAALALIHALHDSPPTASETASLSPAPTLRPGETA